jgi:hypothetical protein
MWLYQIYLGKTAPRRFRDASVKELGLSMQLFYMDTNHEISKMSWKARCSGRFPYRFGAYGPDSQAAHKTCNVYDHDKDWPNTR